ncbi:MAG: glycosyltransferase family 39 protein [Gammaproteobacteria bacterium]
MKKDTSITNKHPVWQIYFVASLFAYIAIHFCLRLVLSDTLELDEAAQLVIAQSFEWGYDTQPPLFTWLQLAVFKLFGISIFSLALLKFLLLAATYYFVYQCALFLIHDHRLALLSAFTLLLLPSIAWESLRDLTHSVLVTSMSAMTFYCVFRLIERGQTRYYVFLGLAVALGVLSKYSFAIVVMGLMFAALSSKTTRRLMADKRIVITVVISLAVLFPHVIWVKEHWQMIAGFVSDQAKLGFTENYLDSTVNGMGDLIVNVTAFLTPFWLVSILIFYQAIFARGAEKAQKSMMYILLKRYFIGILIILIAMIVIAGSTRFQERWFQPILIMLPVYFFYRVAGTEHKPGRLKIYASVLVLFAIVVILGRVAQIYMAPEFERYTRLHLPSRALAKQIESLGFNNGTIIAGDSLTGGNLKLYFPESRMISVTTEVYFPPAKTDGGQCLLVWDATEQTEMPLVLERYLQRISLSTAAPDKHFIEAPLYLSDNHNQRLGLILLIDKQIANRCHV